MNDLARNSFTGGELPYPAGSIIVKEKELLSYRSEENGKWIERGNGVGGMVKRQAGYDPDNGDWEYFYFESLDNIESGRIATCIQCHRQSSDMDYVFGSWNETARQP